MAPPDSMATVVAAYDQLQAQGLVVARRNRGFFVRDLASNMPFSHENSAQAAINNIADSTCAPVDAAVLIRGIFHSVRHKPTGHCLAPLAAPTVALVQRLLDEDYLIALKAWLFK